MEGRRRLRALRWEDVDLVRNRIRVERGWDDVEGDQGTKSGKARTVPVFDKLLPYLEAQRIRTPDPDGLLFGGGSVPFAVHRLRARALAAWEAAGLEPLTLHDARHTAASVMIASGVNAKAISDYMGHSSIQITVDVYGHLMPGWEDETAELVNAYLARFEDS